MKASRFRQLWSTLHEMAGHRRAPSFPHGQHKAAQLFITLSRVRISNGAVAYRPTPAGEDPDGTTSGYRLRPDFDWQQGVIVGGSLDWADFTGAEGLLSSLQRVTGLPDGDDESLLQAAAGSPLVQRHQRPGQHHPRRRRR